MSVRELREIYFKSRRWQPVVAAIINYLSNVDYRIASITHKVNEIDVDKINEIEQEFDSVVDDVENVSERVSALEFRMDDVEEDLAGAHLEWIASDHEAIIKLQKQMQGAYVRFAGASDSTPTTSPYRKILSINENASKIYDTDIKIVMASNANRLEFLKAGKVELTFSCKFTGSAAGQHIAIGSNYVPSTGATQIALSKGTWEEPLLTAIFEVNANAYVYMFAGAASNSARNFTPNSPMTYVHARYIEKY